MAVQFVIKVCCSAEADHRSSTPSGDSHDFTLSPGVLLKTGNVREYMTFPLQGADSECGEPGMIEIVTEGNKSRRMKVSFCYGWVQLFCAAWQTLLVEDKLDATPTQTVETEHSVFIIMSEG